ncbi:hypothetical protein LTR08_001037 [Meristemomyces frigidus]|nr:hypothetical protein LTR08_001037 [Meristemomyces frigidus]
MDWKALVHTRDAEIEHNTAVIDQRSRQLAKNQKEAKELTYRLIESKEKEALAAISNSTATSDKLSKVQLALQIAEKGTADQRKRADTTDALLKSNFASYHANEQHLENQLAQLKKENAQLKSVPTLPHGSNVAALHAALDQAQQERDNFKRLFQSSQNQLKLKVDAEVTHSTQIEKCYEHDQDDEEPPPTQPPRGEPAKRQTAPVYGSYVQPSSQPLARATPAFSRAPASQLTPVKPPRTAEPSFLAQPTTILPRPSPTTPTVPATPKKSRSSAILPLRSSMSTPKASIGSKAAARTDASPSVMSKKRKRSKQEELEAELEAELEDLEQNIVVKRPTPRKKQRASSPTFEHALNFNGHGFLAIAEYDLDGTSHHVYNSAEMVSMPLADLKERISHVVDCWEEKKGGCWDEIFTESGYNSRSSCVTKKMEKGRVNWRPNCEGKYACKDCVEQKRPCFTWDATGDGFLLLPLHEDDRRFPVKEGFEIRYWMNEMTEAEWKTARTMGDAKLED